ncbi:hypothetical protein GC173_08860 [bacterium]|nr:hypothetical protein [bacterium]
MTAVPAPNPVASSEVLHEGFVCFTTGLALGDGESTTIDQAAALLAPLLPAPPVATVFAGQVHGTTVLPPPGCAKGVMRIPSCDGLCTDKDRVALVIRTADCLPLVLLDAEARVCAGLHAGWRGTLENMVARGVEAVTALGARKDRLRLWIGPCIRGDVYEVSEELIGTFVGRWGHLGDFHSGRLLNLPALTRLQAEAAGIVAEQIVDSGLCTYSDAPTFHSHRRQGSKRGHEYTVCGFF